MISTVVDRCLRSYHAVLGRRQRWAGLIGDGCAQPPPATRSTSGQTGSLTWPLGSAASLLAAAGELGGPLGDQILFGQSMPTSTTALAGAPDSPRCLELAQHDQDPIALAVGTLGELGRGEPVVLAQDPLQYLGVHNPGALSAVGPGAGSWLRPAGVRAGLCSGWLCPAGRRPGGQRSGAVDELLSSALQSGDLSLSLLDTLIDCCDQCGDIHTGDRMRDRRLGKRTPAHRMHRRCRSCQLGIREA